MTRTFLFLLMLTSSIDAFAQSGPIIRPESFHAWERGGPLVKFWHEMGSDEARVIITAACTAATYGSGVGYCSGAAGAITQAARQTNRLVQSGNYRGTARIDRHPGEAYYAKFDSPHGYTICTAKIDEYGEISPGAHFAGRIQRSAEDGLGLYAVVPKNRVDGPLSVSFNLLVEYVPISTMNQYNCWPNETLVFLCDSEHRKPCATWPGAKLRE